MSIQADVNENQISRYENGLRFPNYESLVKIAAALKVPLSAFQPESLEEYGVSLPEEAELFTLLKTLSPPRRKEVCEHLSAIITLMNS